MSPSHPLTPFTGLPSVVRLSVVLLAGLTAALIALLWPHWTTNPDLSHGLFMPVIFLLLLRESRAGTFRFLPASAGAIRLFADDKLRHAPHLLASRGLFH